MGNGASKSGDYKRLGGGGADLPPQRRILDTDALGFTFEHLNALIESYEELKDGKKSFSSTMQAIISYRDRLQKQGAVAKDLVNIVDVMKVVYPGFASQPAAVVFRFRHDHKKLTKEKAGVGPMGPKTRKALQSLMDLTEGCDVATTIIYNKRSYRMMSDKMILVSSISFFDEPKEHGEPAAHAATLTAAAAPAPSQHK